MRRLLQKHLFRLASVSLLLWLSATLTLAQTTSFTYQGRLSDGGTPANGTYDLRFALWDSNSGGTQIGEQTVPTVAVSAGIFTVQLDFGATAFPGANRFLEISTRLSGTASFTTLSPRQQITSTPYAIRSLNASSADVVTVNGVPGGSGNYVQNTTTPQASANFNISGNGTAGGTLSANIVNVTTQYNLGGSRILSSAGTNNLFAGQGAGQSNTVGSNNAFFGFNAGAANTGDLNQLTGIDNAIFGASAGEANKASGNAFFGAEAGQRNTTGNHNSLFGRFAGINNVGGFSNSFFGESAGIFNKSGSSNTFFGASAGIGNDDGSNNTTIGYFANVGSSNLTNATAIGANARVDQSNALVLGNSVSVGIGTTTPQATLDVNGAAVFRPGGVVQEVSVGSPNGETGIGIRGTSNRADVRFDGTTLKLVAGVNTGPPLSTNGVAITTAGNVGIGTISPTERLSVSGNLLISGRGDFGGLVKLNQIDSGLGAGTVQLCRNAALVIAVCTSSSLRYKQQIAPFSGGLGLILRLRPISFTWKMDGSRDVGLGAEDVAKVEPLLVTHNDKGEIEGVKYDHLNVVLINAIKQQQEQIETLRAQNAALNARLRSVERILRKKVGSARRRR